MDDRARADPRAVADQTKEPIDASAAIDRAGATNASGWTPGGRAPARPRRARRPARTRGTDSAPRSIAHGAGSAGSPAITAPSARRAERRRVLGVGEEREVAGPGVLDAGDARDLDVAVALEPAAEALGKIAAASTL